MSATGASACGILPAGPGAPESSRPSLTGQAAPKAALDSMSPPPDVTALPSLMAFHSSWVEICVCESLCAHVDVQYV